MSQGWECPKCGRVWAPFVQECSGCRPHPIANAAGAIERSACLHSWTLTTGGRSCHKCGAWEPPFVNT